MKSIFLRVCAALLVSLIGSSVWANGDTSSNQMTPEQVAGDQAIQFGIQLYYMKGCHSCHGTMGEGVGPKNGPKLAGLTAEYIARQLTHFREGVRGTHPEDVYGKRMTLASNSLTDDHIGLLANFVSTLNESVYATAVPFEGDSASGESLYKAHCASCHGVNAEGNAILSSPRLAGQQAAYVVSQLSNYKKKIRGVHPSDSYGMQMVSAANAVPSQQDVADVSAYVAGIGAPEPQLVKSVAPRDVVLDFYNRLDKGDKQAIYDLIADGARFNFPDMTAIGPHGYWAYVSRVGAYIPDFQHFLDDVEVSADDPEMVLVGTITVAGTTAVGVPQSFPGDARYKVLNGKITEAWIGGGQ